MSTALLECPMAENKSKSQSVKLHMDVVETARIVSAYTGENMGDMLSDLLRPILVDLEKREVAKRAKSPSPKR